MLKYFKNLFFIPLLLAFTVLFFLFKYNSNRDFKNNHNVMPVGEDKADMVLEDVQFIETELGKLNLEVSADEARNFRARKITYLNNVKAAFHPSESRKWILSGEKGKIYMDTMNMDIDDNVFIEFDNGYYLSTDNLKYTSQEKKVTTDSEINYWGPRVDLVGKGLIIDLAEETVTIMENVDAQLYLQGLEVF